MERRRARGGGRGRSRHGRPAADDFDGAPAVNVYCVLPEQPSDPVPLRVPIDPQANVNDLLQQVSLAAASVPKLGPRAFAFASAYCLLVVLVFVCLGGFVTAFPRWLIFKDVRKAYASAGSSSLARWGSDGPAHHTGFADLGGGPAASLALGGSPNAQTVRRPLRDANMTRSDDNGVEHAPARPLDE